MDRNSSGRPETPVYASFKSTLSVVWNLRRVFAFLRDPGSSLLAELAEHPLEQMGDLLIPLRPVMVARSRGKIVAKVAFLQDFGEFSVRRQKSFLLTTCDE